MEEFDQILKDIQKVLDKHNVELRIRSEITFVKVDAKNAKADKERKRIRK